MIDEKKLIEELRKYADELGTVRGEIELANGVLKAISIIEKQPKVGEWIQVEERLPNIYKTVLITTYNQEVRTAFLDGDHYWFSGLWTYTFDDVLAWQPLPETYEVKENERP